MTAPTPAERLAQARCECGHPIVDHTLSVHGCRRWVGLTGDADSHPCPCEATWDEALAPTIDAMLAQTHEAAIHAAWPAAEAHVAKSLAEAWAAGHATCPCTTGETMPACENPYNAPPGPSTGPRSHAQAESVPVAHPAPTRPTCGVGGCVRMAGHEGPHDTGSREPGGRPDWVKSIYVGDLGKEADA